MTLYMYSGEQSGNERYGRQAPYDAPKLYSLELDSRSYERLRRQESLLVDFTEFLNNIVWLLEQTCGAGKETGVLRPSPGQAPADPKARRTFRAVLGVGAESASVSSSITLQIKEHTAFRELAHLTLPIQENTDRGMAKFLSRRLSELAWENQQCRTTIDGLEQESRALEEQLTAVQQQMSAGTSLHSNEASTWKMQCDMLRSQVASAKDQQELLKEQLRVAETGAARDKALLAEAEVARTALREETAELREKMESHARTNTNLEETRSHHEREIARLRDLCEGYKSASDMADARVEDWKRMAKSHEEQAGKISRELQALEQKLAKAHHELEQTRNLSHESEHRAAQRDALMQTQEEALKSAQSRVTDLQQQQRVLEAQLDDARKHLDGAKTQAAETAKKYENSEKMIVWLNKQLTSIQLGGGSSATGNGSGNFNGPGSGKGGGGATVDGTGPGNVMPGASSNHTPSPIQPRSRLARVGS
jgi:predicted  nucleic acid-binding Zn-ribbon protein